MFSDPLYRYRLPDSTGLWGDSSININHLHVIYTSKAVHHLIHIYNYMFTVVRTVLGTVQVLSLLSCMYMSSKIKLYTRLEGSGGTVRPAARAGTAAPGRCRVGTGRAHRRSQPTAPGESGQRPAWRERGGGTRQCSRREPPWVDGDRATTRVQFGPVEFTSPGLKPAIVQRPCILCSVMDGKRVLARPSRSAHVYDGE